jgi:small subunit ribosomal protein S5
MMSQKQYTTPHDNAFVKEQPEFQEKVVQIDRVSRAAKGGDRIRFRVLVVIGDKNGRVGYGIGKSSEIVSAIGKAVSDAKRNLIKVKIVDETIPYEINFTQGAAHIILKPARKGTSVIAGGAVRAVIELSGIKNILTKIIGTNNKVANVKATIAALAKLSQENI